MAELNTKIEVVARVDPLRHDGWRSRKITIGTVVLAVLTAIPTVCLFVDGGDGHPIATFREWAGFVPLLVPGVLVPLFGSLWGDKREQAKVMTSVGLGAP